MNDDNYTVIAVVEDCFDLRGLSANRHEYDEAEVLEAMQINRVAIDNLAMFGYVTHYVRELGKKREEIEMLAPPEIHHAQLLGQVRKGLYTPACVCVGVQLSCGVVTHQQAILDTVPGTYLLNQIAVGAGGWSWAIHIDRRMLCGFDYVDHPSFPSLSEGSIFLDIEPFQITRRLDQ